ncbi:MAG TPA: DEAD/DEAH box helicase [Dongiaceae bacterium]|nr:DEAD/DEAH box helicase [Dongiaceae bacterium]
MTTFTDLKLSAPLLQALATEGYETPTPIQAQAIPPLLEGRDLLGIAQTGTGKTAAFALPLLQRLTTTDRRAGPRSVRALILTPTRELCVQILDSFRSYGRHLRLNRAAVYGGVSQGPQVHALSRGVDVLVATPGRLLDLMNQGQVRFDSLEAFVLDEADRMLDMGFIVPVKRIMAKLPKERQTLLFSATMPQAVTGLAASLLKEPVRVEVTPVATTAERISQRVHFVEKANKRALLQHLLSDQSIARALVFARTKHGANKVAEQLDRAGVRTDAIHGNKSQNARQKALNDFRNGKVRVLVATDIAARGIDVDGITHVINFDLPNEPESYVHRIGRTARAGNDGIAISFCDAEERVFLRDIEKTIRQAVAVDLDHPFHAAHIADGVRHGGARQPAHNGNGGRRGRDHGKSERRESRGGSEERTHRQSARTKGERRPHREDGNHPHGREMRKPDSRPEGERGRDARGHRPHSRGTDHREQRHDGQHHEARTESSRGSRPHGHEGNRSDPRSDGDQGRASHGHSQHAHGGPREQRQQQDRREMRGDGQRGNNGQNARGKQHPRRENGGHQPLKRSRQDRNQPHSGNRRPQRHEPVRMG